VSSGAPGAGPASAPPPPFRVPGSHFAAALAFLALGSAGLAFISPELAAGAFMAPRVAAVTHLFTLGWLTTTILGAAYQFIPVALGVGMAWPILVWATLALHVPGVSLMVAGLATGDTTLLLPGAGLVTLGLLLFTANLFRTLGRAPRGGLIRRALAVAGAFLIVAVLLGITLSGNLRWGYLGEHRLLALTLHLHVALLGWVLLVVVGVSQRLVPMFLLSHGAPEWPGLWAYRLVTGGLVLALLLHHAGGAWLGLAALVCGAGVSLYLAQLVLFFLHRRRRDLDPGMTLVAVGGVGLAGGLLLAPVALTRGAADPGGAEAYGAAVIVAGFTPFVAGHLYRIVPFLAWFHRFGARLGTERMPTVAELYSRRVAWAAAAMTAAPALALPPCLAAGAPVEALRAVALLLCAGVTVMALQLARVGLGGPR
jgi:hypothetical protein